MKTNHILIIVGVVILIVVIANWNKIFGNEKERFGGVFNNPNITKQSKDCWTQPDGARCCIVNGMINCSYLPERKNGVCINGYRWNGKFYEICESAD